MAAADLEHALREPLALEPNPLKRFYRAGGQLATFRGRPFDAADERPEDWVGSATRAWTPAGREPTTRGLSKVRLGGRRISLEELLQIAPVELAGRELVNKCGATLGVLVKLLDAGQRLPVHCHPSRSAARAMLGSRFGKTEAWLILGANDASRPRVWAGLREGVGREEFRAWIEAGDSEALLGALVEYPAAAGDTFFIPGGTPHAIGEGVFLLEVQEPTDFSVVAETRDFPISDSDASLGLGWERAIDFFDLRPAAGAGPPKTPESAGVKSLFGEQALPYFRALRMRVRHGQAEPPFEPAYAVGVVLAGGGAVRGASRELQIARGSTFALPAAATEHTRIDGDELDIVWCLGPDPAALE